MKKQENRLRMKPESSVIAALIFSSMFFLLPLHQVEANTNPSIPNPNTMVYTTNEGYLHTLDPALVWDSMVLSNCYDTLVSYDRERVDRFRPLLVTEVPSLENRRISADGLTYCFTIRSDSPLTPEDVEYSFERVMVRGGRWSMAALLRERLLGENSESWNGSPPYSFEDLPYSFKDIDNAVEVEGNDVVFHLAEIYPPFMHILVSSCSSIVSKAWCVEHDDWPGTEETWVDYIDREDSPLDSETQGYGPFILESMADWSIELVRNEDYWRGPARLERVVFRFSDNWEIRKQMFLEEGQYWELLGTADICWVMDGNYSELEGVEGIRVYTKLPTLEYLTLSFNFAIEEDSPYIGSGDLDGNGVPPDFFSDIDTRKAFAYSIDYDTIINKIYAGEAMQPVSPVIEGLSFHNPDQECYTYDLDRARQHFQQAWGGEVWNKGFNLTLVFKGFSPTGGVETNPRNFMIVETLKNSIESINTNFHVNIQPLYWWYRNLIALSIEGERLETDPGLIYFPHQGYVDTSYDSLIEAGMNTVDSAERQAIYYELQRIYHEDVLGIPLVQPLTRHYQRDWVWGWYYNPAAGMNFYEMLKGTYMDAARNIIAHVENLVNNGIMLSDAGDSLTYKLGSSIYLMDMGDLLGAAQQLNVFIEQVSALDLPVSNGDELIALAQEILEVLSKTPVSILMARAFSLSVFVLATGLFIATIALLMDRRKERKWKKLIQVKQPENTVDIPDVRVSITYTLLSRLRESRWNIFRRKTESD
ncbi:MAG: ABC transporter substrate-binding protein [Candidatus Thorarchaeota archaeon SMTZ1-45]|nr:MAG: hypothetical protein AM325_16500 [Candidatus Thorarchaeota archaeon SMTZ1-45]